MKFRREMYIFLIGEIKFRLINRLTEFFVEYLGLFGPSANFDNVQIIRFRLLTKC